MNGELDAEEQCQLADIECSIVDVDAKEEYTGNTQCGNQHDTSTGSHTMSCS